MEAPLSSALLTRVASLRRIARRELGGQCALKLSEYRILSLLDIEPSASARDIRAFLSCGQSTVSKAFSQLRRKNALAEDPKSPYHYALSPEGSRLLSEGDGAIKRAVRSAFEGVPEDLYLANGVGALLNMAPHGKIRMRDRGYFLEFSLLECTLLAEGNCIEASRRNGLSFMEFRVFLSLTEADGCLSMLDLRRGLDSSFAHVSETCATLIGRGLVLMEGDPLDGRRRLLRLTPEGDALARSAASDVALALYEVTANRLSRKEQDAAFMLSRF